MQIMRSGQYPDYHRSVVVVSAFLLALLFAGCGTTMHLPSHWPDQKVVIDGKNTDWDRTYLIDDNKLVIGFVNDSNFVYLLLATNDRPLAMSMMRGLTVWFDPKGGDEKTFGIHYPLGGIFPRAGRSGDTGNDESMEEPTGSFGLPPTELEILGPGKDDRHRMQIMETGGILARYTVSVNSFVYELRVPFSEGDQYPFAIRSRVGSAIGLGLETGQGRMRQRPTGEGQERGDREDGEGGEEGGYEGGGMRGGRRGFGQGGTRESTGPLDIWMNVQLVGRDTLSN